MAHANRILRSINDQARSRCVDVFVRPDGTIGIEEYRRDVEDNRGWFAIGGYSSRLYDSEAAALEAAFVSVPWLRSEIDPER